MARPVLDVSGVDVGFVESHPLIEDLILQISPGEIVGVIGRSGIGKTTLIRTIAGLVPTLSGSILFDGMPLSSNNRGSIGLIPQRLGLVRHQSVGYNVLMGALPGASFVQTLFSIPSREMRDATREAIHAVGLHDKSLESVNKLSGGQQRRVAIARSIVQSPKLLLADECLGELDADTAREIIDLMRGLAEVQRSAILIVDHNPVRARTFCDRLLELRGKKLLPMRDDEISDQLSLPQLGGK